MANISRFEDLEIWKSARIQANNVYLLYCEERFSKDYALRNQINASSGSVMDNIAEGFERSGNKEFIHFLIIAKASNGEVKSQLHRAFDRKYLTEDQWEKFKTENEILSKQIIAFIKYLKGSERKGFRFE
jgi:four helix bundle protein